MQVGTVIVSNTEYPLWCVGYHGIELQQLADVATYTCSRAAVSVVCRVNPASDLYINKSGPENLALKP